MLLSPPAEPPGTEELLPGGPDHDDEELDELELDFFDDLDELDELEEPGMKHHSFLYPPHNSGCIGLLAGVLTTFQREKGLI